MKFVLKKNVILCKDLQKGWILINPYQRSQNKIRRISEKQASLLQACVEKQSQQKKVCRAVDQQVIKKWSRSPWNMVEPKDEWSRNRKVRRAAGLVEQERSALEGFQNTRKSSKTYHEKEIKNADRQFEHVETTVSHRYRIPYNLLFGKSYGAAFARLLLKKESIPAGAHILEIGGGTGIFARDFLDEIRRSDKKKADGLRYHLLDLSSTLQKAQKRALESFRTQVSFILADVEHYRFQKKYDLVICNEVMADLSVDKINKKDICNKLKNSQALQLIRRYQLDFRGAGKEFLFNTGAAKLIERSKTILKTGGQAVFVEYGSKDFYPCAVKLGGHTEYSIHFSIIKQIARKKGFRCQLCSLADFLPFNRKIKMIDIPTAYYIGQELLPHLKKPRIENLIYTKKMLREKIGPLFDRLIHLHSYCIGSSADVLHSRKFWVLHLKKGK